MLKKTTLKFFGVYPNVCQETGVVLLFAMILIAALLSMAFTLSLIFIPKIKSSSQAKDSVGAFFAADTAVEWCLYVNRKDPVAVAPTMSNGATFTILPVDCLSFPMTATGNYKGVTRAVEVNF